MEKEQNLEELRKKIERYREEKDKYLNGWKRARADLLNYKKEERERIEKFVSFAKKDLFGDLLLILDSFKLAEKSLPEKLKEKKEVKGLLQIKKELERFLKKEGVERIDVLGEKYDPSVAEAVAEVEKEDLEEDVVAEVVRDGYTFQGRILRPAKVKVSK